MSIDKIIFSLIAIFAVLGGLDRILGNRLGLGKAFEEGILAMGQLALTMVGILVLSPVLADILEPVVVPVFRWMGADPAMFAGALLACDMGGAPLAQELADTAEAASLGGILTACMLGGTVSFTLPVTMDVLAPKDRPYAAKGILCGIVTIPIGILAGGITAGFSLSMILHNLLPVVCISVIIALGLWKMERLLLKAFSILGKIIIALATVGLTAAGVEQITGITLIKGMGSLEEAFIVIGNIGIVLAGAFPLLEVIKRLLKKPLTQIGKRMHMNNTSVAGLIASLANSIATFGMVKDMDNRGKVLNMAFAVSGAFVFGDHLAFTAGYEPAMIPAMIVGKLCGGISAILVALWVTRKDCKEDMTHV